MLVNRNFTALAGRTTIRLEASFHAALGEIAADRGVGVNEVIQGFERDAAARGDVGSRSEVVRVGILAHFRRHPTGPVEDSLQDVERDLTALVKRAVSLNLDGLAEDLVDVLCWLNPSTEPKGADA